MELRERIHRLLSEETGLPENRLSSEVVHKLSQLVHLEKSKFKSRYGGYVGKKRYLSEQEIKDKRKRVDDFLAKF